MGFQIGIAPRAAGAPVIVLQRDVNILLTVQITGVTPYAALQPVIFFIVTRQTGETVVVHRTGRRDA